MSKLIFIVLFALVSCQEIDDVETGIEVDTEKYEPLFITRNNLDNSIKFSKSEMELETPGKIYRYKNYLLIVDHFKGVHVYDNSNPENPLKIGFIEVPAVTDIAMNKNVLYANNSVDLVAIDVSDIENLKVIKRIRNSFDEPLPPGFSRLPSEFQKENRNGNYIIFKWREKND